MRFGVLGPLEVWTEDGAPVAIPGVKVRALLADLLIHAGQPVPADRLTEAVWPGRMPADPAGGLQSKVSQLRRALEQAQPGARGLVVSVASGYLLRVDAEAVDAGRFEALVARARQQRPPEVASTLLAEALALWRGPALADFADDDFARSAIDRLEEQRVLALEDHAEARLALGDHDALASELADLVATYPLRERLRAAHLHALYRAGRQTEALASYRQLRTQLVDELGVEPGPDLTRLHQAILQQDPDLEGPAAPHVQPAAARGNLPLALSSFVGRAAAVAEVRKLLGAGRLVTLAGLGGVGKTRLAVETAAELGDDLPDGCWLVELAGVDRPTGAEAIEHLAEQVAATLGIRDIAALGSVPAGQRAGMPGRLAGALRAKRLLLVLDGCEHAIGPVAELAALLLRSAPGLQVLATSRQPLGLPGELLWPVPPLDQPVGEDLDALGRSSAVRLFAERAAAAAPWFVLDAASAAAVVVICRRLDGLPLALELAAARVRALGVHALAARLDDRFRVLAARSAGAPAGQQTLRTVMDWSWELLTEPERAVLRRLAVHVDGFTLAVAETVGAGGEVDTGDVLDLLARLVDRSLVVAEPAATGVRYRLLETVAAYALERLEEVGEAESARQRHARWHVALAEEADAQLRGHRQREWLERLDAETGNLQAALTWAVDQGEAALALRLVGALVWYWFLRGRQREGRRSLARARSVGASAAHPDQQVAGRAMAQAWLCGLGSPGPPDSTGEPADEWSLLGFVTAGIEDIDGAPDSGTGAEAAVGVFRRTGDQWQLAAALSVRAWEALRRSQLDAARRDGQESQALFCALGDRWGQARTANLLGVVAEITGDHELATRLHRDGLRMAEDLGLWPAVVEQLSRLGRLSMLAGDDQAADGYHQRALRLAHDQAVDQAVAFVHAGLGLSARRQGRLDAAEAHLQVVLDTHRADGYRLGQAFTLTELGYVAEFRGDAQAARALHHDGLAAAQSAGDPRAVAAALEGLAGTAALGGEYAEAAWLLGVATVARESVDATLPAAERGDVDRIAATARAALGADAFTAELDRGCATGLDAALATLDQ